MPNIFLFASWFFLILVVVITWRRAEPELKIRKTLIAVAIFLLLHASLAYALLENRFWSNYFTVFWSWKVLWFAQ